MTKELKKCYYNLDLPFNATIEQVKTQEKMLIKILRARALKTGKSQNKKIDKIVISANKVQQNIEKNGIPDVKECSFSSSSKDIATEVFILLVLSVIAIISYLSLV